MKRFFCELVACGFQKENRMGVLGTVTSAVFLLQMWGQGIPSGRPEAQGEPRQMLGASRAHYFPLIMAHES